jgi:hypothetical protein
MKNLENFKPFSIKKLLSTIFRSIIVTTFLCFTFLFIYEVPSYINGTLFISMDSNSEIKYEIGQNIENNINDSITNSKSLYGEDYPAIGILLYSIDTWQNSSIIIVSYLFALLLGIVIGTIIYIVSIQKAKGKQLIIEIFATFLILFLAVSLINVTYEFIMGRLISSINSISTDYSSSLYDNYINYMIPSYIAIFIIIYAINMIHQRLLTRKLNKELNNTNQG